MIFLLIHKKSHCFFTQKFDPEEVSETIKSILGTNEDVPISISKEENNFFTKYIITAELPKKIRLIVFEKEGFMPFSVIIWGPSARESWIRYWPSEQMIFFSTKASTGRFVLRICKKLGICIVETSRKYRFAPLKENEKIFLLPEKFVHKLYLIAKSGISPGRDFEKLIGDFDSFLEEFPDLALDFSILYGKYSALPKSVKKYILARISSVKNPYEKFRFFQNLINAFCLVS